jgi:hypothetical protein
LLADFSFTASAPSIAGEVRNPLNPGTLVIMRRLLCQAISVFQTLRQDLFFQCLP